MNGCEKRPEKLRRLGGERPITRRDFIDGIAVAAAVAAVPRVLTAGDAELTASAPQDRPDYNPPTLTGMRGSHPGSFEAAHAVRDGTFPKAGASPSNTGEHYDLIVVGGGISGLAAAYFYRAATGPDARVLILDNHDDFGGHAKRNEFELDGKIQLINGGTLGIDSPRPYSAVAAGLLTAIGIDPAALQARYTHPGFYPSLGLGPGVFFNRETSARIAWSRARSHRRGSSKTRRSATPHGATFSDLKRIRSIICRVSLQARRKRVCPGSAIATISLTLSRSTRR